jgi:RNA polymerase sigma factor (TIGR02999 family)
MDLLVRWSDGQAEVLNDLMPLVYDELRDIARGRLARERSGHTLEPTALAHEAFLRLWCQRRVRWQNRAHFFAVASEMMRLILVEHARKRAAVKRGAGVRMTTLDGINAAAKPKNGDVLELHQALERLAALDGRRARVVELRYFGGLSLEETAEALAVSRATVKRDWETARRWLYRELRG